MKPLPNPMFLFHFIEPLFHHATSAGRSLVCQASNGDSAERLQDPMKDGGLMVVAFW